MTCPTCGRKAAYGMCDGGVMHYFSGDFSCPGRGPTALVAGTKREPPPLPVPKRQVIPADAIPTDPIGIKGLEDLF